MVESLEKASRKQMKIAPYATPCPGLFRLQWGEDLEVQCDGQYGCFHIFRIGIDVDYITCPNCKADKGSVDRTDELGRQIGKPKQI